MIAIGKSFAFRGSQSFDHGMHGKERNDREIRINFVLFAVRCLVS